MSTATATIGSTGKSGTTGLTLDDLSAMTVDQLDALYRAGSMPASFKALNGTPKGRMLAIRGIDKTFLFSPITAFSIQRRVSARTCSSSLELTRLLPFAGRLTQPSRPRAGVG